MAEIPDREYSGDWFRDWAGQSHRRVKQFTTEPEARHYTEKLEAARLFERVVYYTEPNGEIWIVWVVPKKGNEYPELPEA